MNWCILIPLLVGLISAILGYLLGKLLSKGSENNDEVTILKNKVASLEAALKTCRESKVNLEEDLKLAKSNLTSSFAATTLIPFNADAAKAAFGKKIKENDLKIVEGIGPKIEGLFHNFGINTWKALGEASVEKCQEVLDSGGERYRVHKPTTWPQQAKLAYEGKWEDLVKWQDELDGGK
ncbi:hypothetical protein [Tenacibaculum crassostreae]|uniref:hypothetical protein n=1 Tax=Tenacibaculum crassostreae TaxID=502683 RepID=UPI0038967971